ncbi:hypothetical protein [Chryseobacterium polytrichastri]|uniref:Uncharacterized protein n=1 Tax=Chryseobacterium polytrichastri TaxID=1302687 RepID=A0A1M7KIB7_9FLAO|nr:hypothetical protein [Chryseobacterium polytrichastri]SHM64610.1 hypothetical protein SAMN05444267_10626 [Chryseobacterium polytrichastri]
MNKFAHIELNEKDFLDRTLKYIYSVENTYMECSLFINILNPIKKYGSLKENELFLRERLSKLQFIVDYDEVTFVNKISRFSDDTHEQAKLFGDKKGEIENFSKEIFWANQDEEQVYKKICDFKSFDEKIIDKKKFYNVIVNSPFFNVKGWILYYQNLLDSKFSEFSEKIVSGKTI